MKKLLLALIALVLIAPVPLSGAQGTHSDSRVVIRANGSVCEAQGSLSPETITAQHGQQLTITFRNAERMAIEVRNVPGGTFTIRGNRSVTRTFEATSSFVYAAWSLEGNCEKATGRIQVNGGWWQRAWPWGLALLGSVVVIWMVSRAGRKHAKSTEETPKSSQE